MWKHQKSCRKPESSDAPNVPPVRSWKLLTIQNQEINKKLYEDFLIKMRVDEVCRAIEGDDLIMRFGQRLYEEQGHHPHRLPYVAQKMRDLGGLLNVLMSSDIYSHEDAIESL